MSQAPSPTDSASEFLSMLRGMSDDQFSTALALDPELAKKAQKALSDAKQKKVEIDRQRGLALAAASGRPFDPKSWARAKRLVTEAHNEANIADFAATIIKTDANVSPEGESSLLKISLDYLADRERVVLGWPMAVAKAGGQFGYEEVASFIALIRRRGGFSQLGPASKDMLLELFSQPLPWSEYESKIQQAPVAPLREGLAQFYHKYAFNQNSHEAGNDPRTWAGLENLVRSGCQPFPTTVDANAYQPRLAWEELAAYKSDSAPAHEAKVSAFAAMIEQGWCDVGTTRPTDNLAAHHSKSNIVPNCASRSCLLYLPLNGSSIEIFNMICERESHKGFERYDPLGRSRLYFANERMRGLTDDPGPEQKVLLALAQRCMELGDPPESVNSQNPQAKAANAQFANIISSAIERRELGATVAGASAPRTKTRSL